MKKELVLVIIGLTVTMIMGINNIYGKAFADPVHCDLSGWPSCYKVGYDDGLAKLLLDMRKDILEQY